MSCKKATIEVSLNDNYKNKYSVKYGKLSDMFYEYYVGSLVKKAYYINNYINGVCYWYHNENIYEEIRYINGVKYGLAICYFDNGNIRTQHYFIKNMMNGECISNEYGMSTKDYSISDEQNGYVFKYYRSGVLYSWYYYIDGYEIFNKNYDEAF